MKHEKTPGKGLSGKLVALLLALTLVIGCVAGGTVAWLIDTTPSVMNTFTFGDINIKLEETTGNDYKVIPGKAIAKDPKVTVLADSEACYLFVKVEEQNWPTKTVDGKQVKMLTYSLAEEWTPLPDNAGVYYRTVDEATAKAGIAYYVLAGEGNDEYENGVVKANENLTKTDIQAFATDKPTLTFTAYAVQQDGIDTVEAAWAKISPATPTP